MLFIVPLFCLTMSVTAADFTKNPKADGTLSIRKSMYGLIVRAFFLYFRFRVEGDVYILGPLL